MTRIVRSRRIRRYARNVCAATVVAALLSVIPTVADAAAPPASAASTGSGDSSSSVPMIAGAVALLLGFLLIGYGFLVHQRARRPVPVARPAGSPSKSKSGSGSGTESGPTAARRWAGRGRSEADVAPPRSFDAAAAWTVDRALRSLAGLAAAGGTQLPSFYAVSLDADLLQLRLAAPDHEPPSPWLADEEGLLWWAPLRALQAVPLDERIPSPSPRLVTLGTEAGTRVLLDLGQATGVITVEGSSSGVRSVLNGWITELTASPWAEEVRIVVAGLGVPDLLGQPNQPDRLQHVAGVREALSAINGSEEDEFPTGAAAVGSGPGVLILGNGPRGPELEQIKALSGRPDAAWTVVVAGTVPVARWRFTLRPDGRLDTGVLGITTTTAPYIRHPEGSQNPWPANR